MNGEGNGLMPPDAAAEDALRCLLAGGRKVLMLCAGSSPLLSAHSLELVRKVRASGMRCEFCTPGQADSLLHSANVLLADVPLDLLGTGAGQLGMRLLVIDDGENLSESEVASMKRLVNGFGSILRMVVLVARPYSALHNLPLSSLLGSALVWNLEAVAGDVAEQPGVVVSAPLAEEMSLDPVADAEADELADFPTDIYSELPDGTVTAAGTRRSSKVPWYAGLAVIIVTCGAFGVLQWLAAAKPSETEFVYDCGTHLDTESAGVLVSRFGESLPTRVRHEGGQYRVEVGPFDSKAAADGAYLQVLQTGACRIEPVSMATSVGKSNQ